MNTLIKAALASCLLVGGLALAAPKSYQVTGEVTEVRDDAIVVTKGKEKFEIAKGSVTTAAKVGDKVKVDYTMTATAVEVKAAKK